MATHDGRDEVGISSDDERTHDDMQECIEECLNCHAVCTMTLQHCIASGGDRTEVNLVGILLDCAESCADERELHAARIAIPRHHLWCLRRALPCL